MTYGIVLGMKRMVLSVVKMKIISYFEFRVSEFQVRVSRVSRHTYEKIDSENNTSLVKLNRKSYGTESNRVKLKIFVFNTLSFFLILQISCRIQWKIVVNQ